MRCRSPRSGATAPPRPWTNRTSAPASKVAAAATSMPATGNEPGVAFYTHISDQFGPFFTKVIAAAASEAPHVLDGLLYHQTGLQPAEHYTDTGGATDHVFGLGALLGFRFAPRLRDIKDRRLYLLPGMTVDLAIEPLVGGSIDVGHLAMHWDEPLCLAVSIRPGTVTASATLHRLAAYPRQNGLAVAMCEAGRLERTLFTLEWIRSGELRRRAQAGLAKGKAAMRWPARCSSTASASYATGGSKIRPTAPPATTCSWPRSSSGTRAISPKAWTASATAPSPN